MTIRPLIAAALIFGYGAAQAVLAPEPSAYTPTPVTTSYGAYSITYDSTSLSNFGAPTSSFGSDTVSGVVGFNWTLPTIGINGVNITQTFDLPDFTITANAGWLLTGPVFGSLGSFSFAENGSAVTAAEVNGYVQKNGGAVTSMGGQLIKISVSSPEMTTGKFAGSSTMPIGTFSSLAFSGGQLTLSSHDINNNSIGVISSTTSQNLELSMYAVAVPVPEPESYAMMLVGLLAVGTIVRRRQKA